MWLWNKIQFVVWYLQSICPLFRPFIIVNFSKWNHDFYALFFLYRQFIAHYVMSLVTAILSVAFIALPIVGIVWCSGEVSHYYVRINRVNYKKNVTCPDNKTAALVTGGLAAVDSFLICAWCILGTVFFCCFVRSYGFQNRRMRYMWYNIYYT